MIANGDFDHTASTYLDKYANVKQRLDSVRSAQLVQDYLAAYPDQRYLYY